MDVLDYIHQISAQSIKQYLLYQIETDKSADYEADKIIFNNACYKKMRKDFDSIEKLHVLGLYGSIAEIEQLLSQALNQNFQINEEIKSLNDTRGRIIILTACPLLLVLMTVPDDIQVERPFNEKRVEITLFRYLQDICQHIIVAPCPLAINDWYGDEEDGQEIVHPFMKAYGTLKQYEFKKKDLREIKVEETQMSEVKLLTEKSAEVAIINIPNDSEYILAVEQASVSLQDITKGYDILENILGELICIQCSDEHLSFTELQKMCKLKILQDQDVYTLLNDCKTTIYNGHKQRKKDVYDKFLGELTQLWGLRITDEMRLAATGFRDFALSRIDFYNKNPKEFIIPYYEEQELLNSLNKAASTLKLKSVKHSFLNEYKEKFSRMGVILTSMLSKLYSELLSKLEEDYKKITQKKVNQQCYNFKKYRLNPVREVDNSLKSISVSLSPQEVTLTKQNADSIFNFRGLNSKFTQDSDFCFQELQILFFFPYRKNLYDIFIIKQKNQDTIFVVIGIKGQLQLKQKIEKFYKPYFVFNNQDSTLTGFNRRNDIIRLVFNETGIIIDEKVFFNIQDDHIISAAYLDFDQSFILLNQKFQVKKWSVHINDNLQNIQEYTLGENNVPKIQPFKPKDKSANYHQVQSTCSGNYFFLVSQEAVDIFNINNQCIKSIQLQKIHKYPVKIFEDSKDIFIVQLETKIVRVLSNLSSQSELVQKGVQEEQSVKSNFLLDIVKGAFVKFGDNSTFLGVYKDTSTYLYFNQAVLKKIQAYFDALEFLQQAKVLPYEEQIFKLCRSYQTESLFAVVSNRAPVQLCTIENGQLIPLLDGFRQAVVLKQSISVSQKSKLLSFSYLDEVLRKIKGQIFVISIIGRQSSGKSYLLNRLFGTKFAVAASRCTDGIWASVAQIDGFNFLIFDCEGLFSARRTVAEETQLMSFLAGLCDITILNQDLTFNRHLNSLFDNLTAAIGMLSGDSLFKGQLFVAVRDISRSDNKGGEQELLRNMEELKNKNKKQSSFLSVLFNDQFTVQLFHNFELEKWFNQEVVRVRQFFIKMAKESKHWTNGLELLEKMKILLVQLEMQDDENSEKVYVQLQLDNEIENSKNNWVTYPANDFTLFKDIEFYQRNIELTVDEANLQVTFKAAADQLRIQLKQQGTISSHNNEHQEVQDLLAKLLSQRMDLILQKAFTNMPKSSSYTQLAQMLETYRNKLKQFLDLQMDQYSLCEEKCSRCHLKCIEMKSHTFRNSELREQLMKQLEQVKAKFDNSEESIQLQAIEEKISDANNKLMAVKAEINVQNQQIEFFTLKLELLNFQKELSSKFIELKEINGIKLTEQYEINILELRNEIQILIRVRQNGDLVDDSGEDQKDSIYVSNQIIEELDQEEYVRDVSNSSINFVQSVKAKIVNSSLEVTNDISKYEQSLKELEDQKSKIVEMLHNEINANDLNQKSPFQILGSQIQSQFIVSPIQSQFPFSEQSENLNYESEINTSQSSHISSQSTSTGRISETSTQFSPKKSILFSNKQPKNSEQQQILLNFQNQYLDKLQELSKKLKTELDEPHGYDCELQNFSAELKNEADALYNSIVKMSKQNKGLSAKRLTNLYAQVQSIKECIEKRAKALIQSIERQQQLQANIFDLKQKQQEIQQEKQKKFYLAEALKKVLSKLDEYLQALQIFENLKSQIQVLENKIISHEKLIQDYSSPTEGQLDLDQLVEAIESYRKQQNDFHLQESKLFAIISNLINLRFNYSEKVRLESQIKQLDQSINEQHNCGRSSHSCDQECFVCKEGKGCQFKAGHLDEHICEKPDHKCQFKCDQAGCEFLCKSVIKHEGQHKCDQQHDCKVRCKYCTEFCYQQRTDPHEVHKCRAANCIKTCFLCKRKCNSDHAHSIIDDPKAHLCDSSHECNHACTFEGICKIEYQESLTIWKTEVAEFEYVSYKQVTDKEKCQVTIPSGRLNHDGQHLCKTEVHRCLERCYECDAYCIKPINHEGFHETHSHRNKDNQIFTTKIGDSKKITVESDKSKLREYVVGQSSRPETCSYSCIRRGRAHYHLLPCRGGSQCLETLYGKQLARHSETQKYQDCENTIFDEILCSQFWKHQKWSHPCQSHIDVIQKCNAYCGRCKDNAKVFCTKPAWHTDSRNANEHDFICSKDHEAYNGLDIAFVMDCTGSMAQYIQMCKDAILRIMQEANKLLGSADELRFAIVGYRDHEPQGDWLVKSSGFVKSNEATGFLNELSADSGGDYPEAVLDGLNVAVNLEWRFSSEKILFLIGDAPPHGFQYHGLQDHDTWPEGCPCSLNEISIFKLMNSKSIDFKILALHDGLNLMISIFKQYCSDLEQISAENVEQYELEIAKSVCQILECKELTYKK